MPCRSLPFAAVYASLPICTMHVSYLSDSRCISPMNGGQRCVRVRARRDAWDRKPCRQPLTGSASMTASPRFRASQQTPLTAKHSLEPFANHPFRSSCRIAPRSFPKLLRLLLKSLRLFLLPGIVLHFDKILGGGVKLHQLYFRRIKE